MIDYDGPPPFELQYDNVRRKGRILADVKLVDRDTGEAVVSMPNLPLEQKFHRDRFAESAAKRFGYTVVGDITDALAEKVDEIRRGVVVDILDAGDLIEQNPTLRPPQIEGVARPGDVVTLVGGTKTRKSWAALALLMCTATGRAWLARFGMLQGECLLIDNELHKTDIAYRIREVARGLGVMREEYATRLKVWSLRGHLMDVCALCDQLEKHFQSGQLRVIVLDALYRMYPEGTDENSNSDATAIYNRLAGTAERLGAVIVVVHHTSKGVQGAKGLTDLGAGAGAFARAGDAHIGMREHVEPDCVVLQIANRSFVPAEPLGLCWNPATKLWEVDPDLDVTQLKTDKSPRQPKPKEEKPPKEVWDVERFAAEFITDQPQTAAVIVSRAGARGLSGRKAEQFLKAACDLGHAHRWEYGQKRPDKYADREPLLGEVPTPEPKAKPAKKRGAKR